MSEADAPEPAPPDAAVRPAAPADVREVAELWHEAFPGRHTVEDRVRMLEEGGRYGGLETVLVARDPDGLAGALKIYRMEEHLAGATFPMMGLAAVAVEPSRRRRGLGARLCSEAIRVAAARGDIVSVLYPFRPDYYERLGWGLVGGLLEHRFEIASLPAYEEAAAVRRASARDRDAIADCYHRVASRSNGPITRDRTVWNYRLADQDLGVQPLDADAPEATAAGNAIVHDDGGVRGYALLRFSRARRSGDRRVDIRELLAETETAYRGLLGHIATLREAWPRARHYARPEERFEDRLRDPRPPGHRTVRSLYYPTARLVRGPMLRVLDVPAALRRRGYGAPGGGADGSVRVDSFRVAVRDPVLPGNEGPWRVRPGPEGATVEPEREEGGPGPELRTDAATFSRIYAGELKPTDAARLGRAEVSRGTFLDQAFATRESFWLLDEF